VRHGRDAVTEFFSAFGATMEVEEFTPVSFAANDTDVLTVVRFRDGKIAYYRGSEDTAVTAAVLQG
jgi:hypothetical protein